MSAITTFFIEIDRLWKPQGAGKIKLRVIGSGALLLQTDYQRGTKDGDVTAMINKGLVPHKLLVERFNAAVDGCFSMDSRAEDLPKIIKNLHRVERDTFRIAESEIDLPDWMQ